MYLVANCRVAKLNFMKVHDIRSKISYRGWLHLLINHSMLQYYDKEDIEEHVQYDLDGNNVFLIPDKPLLAISEGHSEAVDDNDDAEPPTGC